MTKIKETEVKPEHRSARSGSNSIEGLKDIPELVRVGERASLRFLIHQVLLEWPEVSPVQPWHPSEPGPIGCPYRTSLVSVVG